MVGQRPHGVAGVDRGGHLAVHSIRRRLSSASDFTVRMPATVS